MQGVRLHLKCEYGQTCEEIEKGMGDKRRDKVCISLHLYHSLIISFLLMIHRLHNDRSIQIQIVVHALHMTIMNANNILVAKKCWQQEAMQQLSFLIS